MSPQPGEQPPTTPSPDSASLPRFAIIGAGSRGNAYAQATVTSGLGTIEAVVEPIAFKRRLLASQFIGPDSEAHVHQHFSDHHQFIAYEWQRRENHRAGRPGVDGVFVCVRDELHADVVTALAPLQLHILCEKPLATTLDDCLRIQRTLGQYRPMVFAIGHVLRYSPHNMLLRHLVREKRVIGEVLSIEHTEPVGWWHFSHSYVRCDGLSCAAGVWFALMEVWSGATGERSRTRPRVSSPKAATTSIGCYGCFALRCQARPTNLISPRRCPPRGR